MIADLCKVALSSLVSLVVLFFLTKLMGHKQVSQLNLFDYVIGISIGSIAAEMASEIESPARPLVAMVIYGLTAVLISIAIQHSDRARRFLTGTPTILMRDGVIYRKKLKKAMLNVNDLLTEMRCQGYFSPAEIQIAMLEENGRISFLAKAEKKPLTPEDMGQTPPASGLGYDVILDGVIMTDTLRKSGRNEAWLKNELKKQGKSDTKGILLGYYDGNENLTLYADRS